MALIVCKNLLAKKNIMFTLKYIITDIAISFACYYYASFHICVTDFCELLLVCSTVLQFCVLPLLLVVLSLLLAADGWRRRELVGP